MEKEDEVELEDGTVLKEGEFNIYDYYWKDKVEELPLTLWRANDKGPFRKQNIPYALNGSVLMLAIGKLRPMLVLSDPERSDLEYPLNLTCFVITSLKPHTHLADDTYILPPFEIKKNKDPVFNCVTLSSIQTINKKMALKCHVVAQLGPKPLAQIVEKFNCLHSPR